MNAITQAEPVSHGTLEAILTEGDLGKLQPAQRVEYMTRTCQSLGLNPLTRPFRFLRLNGQIQMYATRDCADQLRASRKISLTVVDKSIDGDLFCVTVRATTPDGRNDEDMGAVTLGQLKGEARANAIMKGITKAKRRVTLSICGLGFLDEFEAETLPHAQTFDAEADEPTSSPASMRSFIGSEEFSRQKNQKLAYPAPEQQAPQPTLENNVEPQSDAPTEEGYLERADRELLETNPLKWKQLLCKLLDDAPDKESAETVIGWPIVSGALTSKGMPPDFRVDINAAIGRMRKKFKAPESPPKPIAGNSTSKRPFIADIHDYESGDVLEGPFTDAVDWSIAYRDHLKKIDPEEANASVIYHWKIIEDARSRDPEAKKRLVGLEAPKE